MMKSNNKFVVIRDTKEKVGFWEFGKSSYCEKTIWEKMNTGDYTIQGLENKVCIERKASTGEIAGNLYTKQFENEMKRMLDFPHRFVICEFTLGDLYNFPYHSGIPNDKWHDLRVNAGGLVKRLFELQIKYNCPFIFAGDKGQNVAFTILKQIAETYGNCS